MIKVINPKLKIGKRFHYAHLICDCLFLEINNNVHEYDKVYRIKNIYQTLGNFDKIYNEVMKTTNIELPIKEFNSLHISTIKPLRKVNYSDIYNIHYFRNYIFNRYSINYNLYDDSFPKILLIKRGKSKKLISDKKLEQKIKTNNITSGKERREINNIDLIEKFLKNKFSQTFNAIYLENLSFEKQVKYFNNSKMIICAHGAGMSNIFFCKPKTKILEVTCGGKFQFFDTISKKLNLIHSKCHDNNHTQVIKFINDADKNNKSIIIKKNTK